MDDFEVGKLVVCIEKDWKRSNLPPEYVKTLTLPVYQHVYTIRDIVFFGALRDPYFLFKEIVNPRRMFASEPAFCHICFRPLRDDELKTFRELIKTKPLETV